jgi:hypothetical protein
MLSALLVVMKANWGEETLAMLLGQPGARINDRDKVKFPSSRCRGAFSKAAMLML